MNNFIFPIFILIIVISVFRQYYFSKKAIVKRKLKKATGKKISEFMTGDIAKVVGEVEYVGEPLKAPLSGRHCAYYYVLIEERVSTGKSSHWKELIEEEVAGKFVIKDGKNRAFINAENIKSYVVQDCEYSSGFGDNATATLEQYLQEHGEESEGFFGMNRTLRYKEGILEAGELMAVIGRGEWKTPSQVDLPESYGRVLVISSTDEEPVYLSDDPDTVEMSHTDSLTYVPTNINKGVS